MPVKLDTDRADHLLFQSSHLCVCLAFLFTQQSQHQGQEHLNKLGSKLPFRTFFYTIQKSFKDTKLQTAPLHITNTLCCLEFVCQLQHFTLFVSNLLCIDKTHYRAQDIVSSFMSSTTIKFLVTKLQNCLFSNPFQL